MHKLDSSVPALKILLTWVGLKVPKHTAIGIRAKDLDHTQYLLELSKKELLPDVNTPVNEPCSCSVAVFLLCHRLVKNYYYVYCVQTLLTLRALRLALVPIPPTTQPGKVRIAVFSKP
jgi:hypothetical protein